MSSGTTEFALLGDKSPGVKRIEAISQTFTKWTKVSLFVGIFLIAYGLSCLSNSATFSVSLIYSGS